jgi:hypothetical protein
MSRQYYATRELTRCAAPAPSALANPNAIGTNSRMAGFVSAIRSEGRRKNTALAFDPKQQEYQEFCEHVYSMDPFKYTIDAEKCYRFMFYTAFRNKKPTGWAPKKVKKKKKQGNDAPDEDLEGWWSMPSGSKFNTQVYDTMSKVFERPGSHLVLDQPKNPVGKDTFNTYKAVVKSMHLQQQRIGANNTPWEFVWDLNCKELHQHVKERMPAVRKANFVEKHGEFAPYQIVEKYQDIESEF